MIIRELRKKSGKTQLDVANELGIPRTTYANYEAETSEPNLTNLLQLANYFNVSLDELCGRNFGNDLPILSSQDKEAIKMFCALNDKQKNLIYGEIKICYMQNQI